MFVFDVLWFNKAIAFVDAFVLLHKQSPSQITPVENLQNIQIRHSQAIVILQKSEITPRHAIVTLQKSEIALRKQL